MMLLASLLIFALSISAYDFKSGELYYNITPHMGAYTVEVTYEHELSADNYDGLSYVTVPASVVHEGQEYAVTAVGQWAFRMCPSLIAVYLPSSIRTIGDEAFRDCQGLMGVDLPSSLRSIGSGAWYGCDAMSQLRLPKGLNYLGSHAFYGCSRIAELEIPVGVQAIADYTFFGCSNLQRLVLPEVMYSIGHYAMQECIWLKELNLPTTLSYIGNFAFYGAGLEQLVLPEQVTHIGDYAFYDCAIRVLDVRAGMVPYLGAEAFNRVYVCYVPCGMQEQYLDSEWQHQLYEIHERCEDNQIRYTTSDSHPAELYIDHALGVDMVSNEYLGDYGVMTFDGSISSIGNMAFAGSKNLRSIELPATVEYIGAAAFMSCKQLEEITLPNAVSYIGVNAFSLCPSLRKVELGSQLESIGAGCFAGSSMLDTVYVRAAVPPTITKGTFVSKPVCYVPCASLNDYLMSDWLMEIGEFHPLCGQIFYSTTDNEMLTIEEPDIFGDMQITAHYATGLQDMFILEFDRELTRVPESAFANKTTLRTVILPYTTEEVAYSAFANCTSLESVAGLEHVKTVGETAFYGCESLLEANVSAATSIGSQAFAHCTSLDQITLNSVDEVAISDMAFAHCTSLVYAYVPASVVNLPSGLFSDCRSMVACGIEDGVLSVGDGAFANCASLISVDLPASILWVGNAVYAGCTGVGHIESMAMLAPQLGQMPFEDIASDVPVLVPCGSGKWYRGAAGWERFTNIEEHGVAAEVIRDTICQGESFEWDGVSYTESGYYTNHYTSVRGCDSVATLDLVVVPAIETTYIDTTVCYGMEVEWWNRYYSEAGEYSVTVPTAYGCDSTIVLRLTVLPEIPTVHLDSTICSGDSLWWNEYYIYDEGAYEMLLTTAAGCDSAIVLHLHVEEPLAETHVEQTICDGEILEWHGEHYSEAGEYTMHLTTAAGCDSIVVMHLSVLPVVDDTYITHTLCPGESFEWYGESYTEEGEYSITLQGANGCDSVVIMNLYVAEEIAETHVDTVLCYGEELAWEGLTLTRSGEYSMTLASAQGCDSVVVMHLVVLPEVAVTYIDTTVCHGESVVWYNQQYTESGSYSLIVPDMQGCDSTLVLRLTVLPAIETTYVQQTICHGEALEWEGERLTASGEYSKTLRSEHGCDSVVVMQLVVLPEVAETHVRQTICHGGYYHWQGSVYHQTGEYSLTLEDQQGCDSVVTLHLVVLPAAVVDTLHVTRTSEDDPYVWRGNLYTTTGRYEEREQYVGTECDSAIHVLELTVLVTDHYDETSVTICESELPYTWYDQTLYQGGRYSVSVKYAGTHYDSVQHVLNLQVNSASISESWHTICQGETYEWNGEAYTQAGEYSTVLRNTSGCDSIAYLHLDVRPIEVIYDTLVTCDSYEWKGQVYTLSGDYTYRSTNAYGCEKVEHLHLTINQSEYVADTVTACERYEWHGMSYTSSGHYVYYGSTKSGCPRTEMLYLTIVRPAYAESVVTACDSYEWHGQVYTDSGDYTYRSTDANGCENVEVLHLTIHPSERVEEYVTACDYYDWNDQRLTESGTYTYRTDGMGGCERVEVLHLTIGRSYYSESSAIACDSYEWHGQVYTYSGDFLYQNTTESGCEHTEILHLTIHYSDSTAQYIEACDSYKWHGEVYTESGSYTYRSTSANGCEKIETIILTINHSIESHDTVVACHSYYWDRSEVSYTESGTYIYRSNLSNGCERLEYLHLTILPREIIQDTIIACNEYTWHGYTYTQSGDYVFHSTSDSGCDREELLHLVINHTETKEEYVSICDVYEWNGEIYTESGDYEYRTTSMNGCDSLVVLHLSVYDSDMEESIVETTEPYLWHGEYYYETGVYTYTTTKENGCDHVEVLYLIMLSEPAYEYEEVSLCPSELPYTWYDQELMGSGFYSSVEYDVQTGRESLVRYLTLNLYSQTLPTSVTPPVVRIGDAIDVTIPTEEIQAHIAADDYYAPNAEVNWYVLDGSEWEALSNEAIAEGVKQVAMKYAVDSDCGTVVSEPMTIDVIISGLYNTQNNGCGVRKIIRDEQVLIIRNGKAYSLMGIAVD